VQGFPPPNGAKSIGEIGSWGKSQTEKTKGKEAGDRQGGAIPRATGRWHNLWRGEKIAVVGERGVAAAQTGEIDAEACKKKNLDWTQKDGEMKEKDYPSKLGGGS